MQKRKKWQSLLIFVVILLTVYNILPTVFYYTKPLKSSIDAKRAEPIAEDIVKRVNSLEKDSIAWISSFCKLLKISPASITLNPQTPQQIEVVFTTQQDAEKFQEKVPRAGALIPFLPAQLSLSSEAIAKNAPTKKIIVERQIPIHLDKSSLFQFSFKNTPEGKVSDLYKKVLIDRMTQLALSVGGESETTLMATTLLQTPEKNAGTIDLALSLSREITSYAELFGKNSPFLKRYFSQFGDSFSSLTQAFDNARDSLKIEKSRLQGEEKKQKEKNLFSKEDLKQTLAFLEKNELLLIKATEILKQHRSDFSAKKSGPWEYSSLFAKLFQDSSSLTSEPLVLTVEDNSPFINQIILDPQNDKILLSLHPDLISLQKELSGQKKNQLEQFLIDELARITRQTDEQIALRGNEYTITLSKLPNSKSFLLLQLDTVARKQAENLQKILLRDWNPKHPELSAEAFPIFDYETFSKLPAEQKLLCLVVYAPASQMHNPEPGLRNNSIYVIAKGLDRILRKYQSLPESASTQQIFSDFQRLNELLKQNGFIGYSGKELPLFSAFHQDFIFEKDDFYQTLLKATREQFSVYGSKKFALLEFTDVEQRILTINQIETSIHEDLLKWKDDYHSAQVNLNSNLKFDFPAPTKNVFWSNFVLSFSKYFRGDDRKILHWGLDLSGGKTVQIELRDLNNRPVKNEASLKQGMNELYQRVNKMGVSEVSIRTIDSNIVLDFPGSQGLSAHDLIKASSMYFHVVNEKFAPGNLSLANAVNRFLQEIWNEAVVTNRKDSENIQLIAWKHLYGDSLSPDLVQPRSEAAKVLYENGLRLSSPLDTATSSTFDDTLSKIAIFRGTEWYGQTHPLLIVFKNYALEGSQLDNIRASYDPSKGNYLSFEVKSSFLSKDGQKINPRESLFAWTSQFSKEKIHGTPLETFSKGRGWRMAVILNDSIISAPGLDSAIRDNAMISGSFSQREVNLLAADLKAGSLSYTPHILSEKNVSPELGMTDRMHGILASAVALVLVVATMIFYYRFFGLVASVAVFFNLLILWATLQNLQATLTLAGIAGIILTVGMAVDANVLVFERMREEFQISGRLGSAIQNGYKKAFSAILDSNVTTIIAAMILLHFDSGPIKSFAITLLIGIISSFFTALFVTKAFFQSWAQNPKHTSFKVMNLFSSAHFDFLKNAKYAIFFSLFIIILGSITLFIQRKAIFGMDFTGGYSLTFEVSEKGQKNVDYQQKIEQALLKETISIKDFHIRQLSPSSNLQVLFGMGMEQTGKPFHGMPLHTDKKDLSHSYETNPRIVWLVKIFEKNGIFLTERSLSNLEANWTSMSGQMSDTMRNNAIFGILLALLCIFIYITFRFEYKYATSAIVCLIHDVFICLGSIALLNYLKIPIQIDLHAVAAIMTMVGYSLNDTIIVFDRIREELKLMRTASFYQVINHALNVTLSRTMLTSGTTLMMLLALVFLGGSSLFGFALVMVIGVVFGTLSSLFIAAPLLLFLHRTEANKKVTNKPEMTS